MAYFKCPPTQNESVKIKCYDYETRKKIGADLNMLL